MKTEIKIDIAGYGEPAQIAAVLDVDAEFVNDEDDGLQVVVSKISCGGLELNRDNFYDFCFSVGAEPENVAVAIVGKYFAGNKWGIGPHESALFLPHGKQVCGEYVPVTFKE